MILNNLVNTQSSVAIEISESIENGFLPQSILLTGPSGSSRLTAAFDMAFYLSGNMKGRDLLSASNIIYFPSRNLQSQKDAAISLFDRQRTKASRLFLISTIRTILMQYHPALLGFCPASMNSYFAAAEEIGSAIMEFEDDRDYSDKEIKALLKLLKDKLTPQFITRGRKSQTVSIDEIRAIQKYFSEGQDEKFAIIENLEESNEGAKNSLLKILEEPYPHCHIFLISNNPQRLLQTILSRVRKFTFPALGEKTVSEFLSRQYSLYRKYDSFETFFFEEGTGEEERAKLVSYSKMFANALLGIESLTEEDRSATLAYVDNISFYKYFRNRVIAEIRQKMLEGAVSASKSRKLLEIMNKWAILSDVYNMSQRVAIDSIIREANSVK